MIQSFSAALALGLSLSLFSGGAAAAELKARPGLWENQVSVRSGDAQLDQLAADAQALWHELTPELREMVEETMSARGLSLASVPGAPRVCITAQQAARDELPSQSEQCTPLQTAREGNKVKVKFRCDPELAAAGEGELDLLSPTRYEGTTRLDSAVSGQPQRVTLVVEGRWLAPSCRPAGLASR